MSNLPYVTSPGNIDKAFDGIKAASVPERVSQDFVKTVLKIPGGSGDQMTSFLKKIGLAATDGAPTERYRRFRNPATSKAAVAESIREAYSPLYVRNEYMHELNDEELTGLVVEVTGAAHDASTVKLTVSCIKHLKDHARFDVIENASEPVGSIPEKRQPHENTTSRHIPSGLGLNLGYTINLNLPATSDPAVFDAIFKSLKQHLLTAQDG